MLELRCSVRVFAAEQRLSALRFGLQRRRRFYRDLAGLMKAGLSKVEALDTVRSIASASGRSNAQLLARVLEDVQSGMRNGLSFAGSLEGWIPGEERMLIESMEAGDRFPQRLEAFSQSLKRQAVDRGKVTSELAYPVLLMCMIYGLLVHFHMRIAPILGDLLPRSEWMGVARQLDAASGFAAGNLIAACALTLSVGPATILLLRRWGGRGRIFADRLPIFAGHRARTGVMFLKSMGSLTAGGMTGVEAIERIRPGCCPYVRRRLDLIRFNLLNGSDLGSAIELSGTGWPDRDLALSLQALVGVPDFPLRLTELAEDWEQEKREELARDLASLRAMAFLIVFAVISMMILSMYSIQSQITSGFA